jgi:succinate-acetate transporter protein
MSEQPASSAAGGRSEILRQSRGDTQIADDGSYRPAGSQPAYASTSATSSPAIADPGPLGLAAFAMTTFVLSVFNSNIISDAKLEAVVLPLALFYGGIAQFAAGMWEFRKGNTFGATAFTSYGAFWMSFAAYVKFVAPGLPAESAYKATGLYLLGWSIFTAYMFLASLRVSGAVALVFGTLTATFVLLTIGELAQKTNITHVGGVVGIITAAGAWYASCAGVANDTWKRTVLPTFPARAR